MSNYSYSRKVALGFHDAIEAVKSALSDEGFGVLTEIDVKSTMKKKLDKDMEEYVILGVCNPKLASRAFDLEKEIGLLLPCNVIVYENDGEVFVSLLLPTVAMSFVDNDSLSEVANIAEPKLISAIENI